MCTASDDYTVKIWEYKKTKQIISIQTPKVYVNPGYDRIITAIIKNAQQRDKKNCKLQPMLKLGGIILLIIIRIMSVAKAQDSTRFLYRFMHDGHLGIAVNDLPGFIWAHSDKNKNIYGPGNSFELQFIKKTSGTSAWEIKYKLPRISVSFLYSDFGKPNLTGKAYSIIPQFEFGIIRKPHAELNFKLGLCWGRNRRFGRQSYCCRTLKDRGYGYGSSPPFSYRLN